MLFTIPDATRWAGQDVFILGGGSSLLDFDFELLRGRLVVGCNMAYVHGPEICPVCIFSDHPFFDANRFPLEEYHEKGGEIWTIARELFPRMDIQTLVKKNQRKPRGLWHGANGIGFGGSTGCAAANLALQFGAKRVLLLGMDCKLHESGKRKNWHEAYPVKVPPDPQALFTKFTEGWRAVANDLPVRFPGRHIINLGPDSDLTYFPKEDYRSWLSVPQMQASVI